MESKKSHSLVYRNDIPMPELKSREMDFLMKILYELGDKFNNKREIHFNAIEFFKDIKKENSYNRLYTMFKAFADKILLRYALKIPDEKRFIAFVCFEKCEWDLDTNEIIITAQKDFYELLMDEKKPYTIIDLEEYWDLTCEYAKRLYPLLKKWNNAEPNKDGEQELIMKWEDFKKKLYIPEHYKSGNISQKVINPLLKDLTKERNLFSGDRVIFKDLKCKKEYKIGRGRGGKVIARLKFTWKKQQETPKQTKKASKDFNLSDWIGSKWHHSDIGDFEIVSGDVAVASKPVYVAYKLLENGNYGEIKGKNLDELRKKLAELTPYAH